MLKIRSESLRNLKNLQKEYNKCRSVVLPGLLHKNEIQDLSEHLSKRPMIPESYTPDGKKLSDLYRIDPGKKIRLLVSSFAHNELSKLISKITDFEEVTPIRVEFYSQKAKNKHYLDWHTDLEIDDSPGLALSVPLVHEDGFEGAHFQIRDRQTSEILSEIEPKQGDAYIFDISDNLEHRTSQISSGERISMTYFFNVRPT